MPVDPASTPLSDHAPAGGLALLIVDMLGPWDFDGADKMAESAPDVARSIRRLKERCRRSGVPTVYANDNHGRWRSDFRHCVDEALRSDGVGAGIARALHPHEDDYFVLKPKHSAFYATPLDLLLQHLAVRQLIVTGVSSDQCVLITAAEAAMRDYEVLCPADCMTTQTPERQARALRHFGEVLQVSTELSSTLSLPA